MSRFADQVAQLSPQKLALLAVQLQARLDRVQRVAREPIAVIGMGCRFPGEVVDPESLWSFLDRRGIAAGEIPPQRWDVARHYDPDPDAPGCMSTRRGGFLADVDGFDARFFGLSPREAVRMDPQQRLVLEVAWEAIERAGVTRQQLAGQPTGVFIGIYNHEYATLHAGHPEAID